MTIDEQIEALREERIKVEAEIKRAKIQNAEIAAELDALRKRLQQRRRRGPLNLMPKGNA
jgi:septal ring factor EnvC (AmiA/AmiB activator)